MFAVALVGFDLIFTSFTRLAFEGRGYFLKAGITGFLATTFVEAAASFLPALQGDQRNAGLEP